MGNVENIRSDEQAGEHTSAEAIPIGKFLRNKMQAEQLPPRALANQLGIHPQNIYNILKGARPVSSRVALLLSRRFAEPPEFWLSSEVAVSADVAQQHQPAMAPPLPANVARHTRLVAPSEQLPETDPSARMDVLADKVARVLPKLFEYAPMEDGEFKAEADRLRIKVVGDDQQDAEQRAVAAFVRTLPHPGEAANAYSDAVRESLDRISMDLQDARAVMRTFELVDPVTARDVARFFGDEGDKKTVYDTISLLRLSLPHFVIRMMEMQATRA